MNGALTLVPGSHRWGMLDGKRDADSNMQAYGQVPPPHTHKHTHTHPHTHTHSTPPHTHTRSAAVPDIITSIHQACRELRVPAVDYNLV